MNNNTLIGLDENSLELFVDRTQAVGSLITKTGNKYNYP